MAATPKQQPRRDVDPGQRDSRRYIDLDRPSTCAEQLVNLLTGGTVLSHPFVIGEIALAGLRNPARVLKELQRLLVASVATDQEVLRLIRDRALGGRGIGYVDAHLVAAVRF